MVVTDTISHKANTVKQSQNSPTNSKSTRMTQNSKLSEDKRNTRVKTISELNLSRLEKGHLLEVYQYTRFPSPDNKGIISRCQREQYIEMIQHLIDSIELYVVLRGYYPEQCRHCDSRLAQSPDRSWFNIGRSWVQNLVMLSFHYENELLT